MKISTLLSTLGGSPLQVGLERGFASLGHSVEPYQRGRGYDLIVVFNQVAHNPAYEYPHFPDEHTPICFVDSAEFGYFCRLPDRARLYANTFAQGSMAHDTKNRKQQIRLKSFLEGRSFPYFLREMHKDIEYPNGYHPIDYPLYAKSECHEPPNREEYVGRDLELFSSWGHSHPWRKNIEDSMRRANRKAEIGNRWEDANLPQDYYFSRMRAAKCTVSYDGYGSGSFRMTEALCRTLLLQGPLAIRTRAALIDGETCRAYTVDSDGETFLSTNVGEVMADALADVEGSFDIYERGYNHVHEHLSETATARYVLEIVDAHDWSQVTPLEV